jgi:hypothetical protein
MTNHEDTTSMGGWENEPSIAPGSRPRDPRSTGANRKSTGKTDRAAPDETKPDAAETPTGALKPYEPVDLWGSFDPPELPKDLLPPIIEEFAFTEGANMGCDPAGLAMSALTVCAAAIPDGVQLLMKMNSDQWKESARIWTAVAWGLWPTLRFPSPLIKPDEPISGIRLSDWLHREVHGEQTNARGFGTVSNSPSPLDTAISGGACH